MVVCCTPFLTKLINFNKHGEMKVADKGGKGKGKRARFPKYKE